MPSRSVSALGTMPSKVCASCKPYAKTTVIHREEYGFEQGSNFGNILKFGQPWGLKGKSESVGQDSSGGVGFRRTWLA